MRLIAAMLATKVEHAIPALVIRMPLEGRLFVGTTCPPGGEQDRLFDWICSHDDLRELMVHAFETLPYEDDAE